jgi:hypothetical protein
LNLVQTSPAEEEEEIMEAAEGEVVEAAAVMARSR